MPLWQREVFVRREHCEVLTRVLLQYRLLLRFSCSWSKLEAEICRIAVRNIVSASGMLGARRKRGLGGRGGRRQAVSAAFIAFSNRGPPKSDLARAQNDIAGYRYPKTKAIIDRAVQHIA